MSTIAIIIGTAVIAAPVGFLVCAFLTAGKVADAQDDPRLWNELCAADMAHARCADALTTCQRKLSAIRDMLAEPRPVRKGRLAEILDGEAA